MRDTRVLGMFSLNGRELPGELRLSEDTIRLYLWSSSFINSNTASSTISGILSDNRLVTLIECDIPPIPDLHFVTGIGIFRRDNRTFCPVWPTAC